MASRANHGWYSNAPAWAQPDDAEDSTVQLENHLPSWPPPAEGPSPSPTKSLWNRVSVNPLSEGSKVTVRLDKAAFCYWTSLHSKAAEEQGMLSMFLGPEFYTPKPGQPPKPRDFSFQMLDSFISKTSGSEKKDITAYMGSAKITFDDDIGFWTALEYLTHLQDEDFSPSADGTIHFVSGPTRSPASQDGLGLVFTTKELARVWTDTPLSLGSGRQVSKGSFSDICMIPRASFEQGVEYRKLVEYSQEREIDICQGIIRHGSYRIPYTSETSFRLAIADLARLLARSPPWKRCSELPPVEIRPLVPSQKSKSLNTLSPSRMAQDEEAFEGGTANGQGCGWDSNGIYQVAESREAEAQRVYDWGGDWGFNGIYPVIKSPKARTRRADGISVPGVRTRDSESTWTPRQLNRRTGFSDDPTLC
ncbi:hypothetical protein S7711_11322 [Stachybotrys chartarum IBT 7711]|uniref:Uncharacterized protein n=1 Tax=Stachybotrys chartarum (strain CBS 109288 / IBT 7711) TaxID=1280523 RepID=A0A084AYS4_STACB|nr:hypothetical protein S7711_11322 [Stachybotrys chartarum IBT 7711]